MHELTIAGNCAQDDSDGHVTAEIGHQQRNGIEKARDLFAAATSGGGPALELRRRDPAGLVREETHGS